MPQLKPFEGTLDVKPFEGTLDPQTHVKPFDGLLDSEKASTTGGDVAKSLGQGLAEGVGFPLQWAGSMVAQAANRAARGVNLPDPELRAENPLQGVVDYLERKKTPGGRRAVELSTPTGDVLQPSTWSLGEDPSAGGYMQNVARVVGQFGVPLGVGAAGRVVKAGDKAMDVAGAVSGAAQAGGAALDQEGRLVRTMDEEKLRASSPRYVDYLQQGLDPATARERVAQDTELAAGTIGAVPAALEGSVIQRMLRGRALLPTVGKTALPRIATAGVSGAVGEGIQETTEQVAQNIAANVGAGGDRALMEDTFGSALLGAAGGKIAGAGIQTLQEFGKAGSPSGPAKGAAAPEKAAAEKRLFPFQSESAADKRAENKTETTGEPHVVIPHPEREGRFAVVPQSELAKFTAEATDKALASIEKQGTRDLKAQRDYSQTGSPPREGPQIADASRIIATVNANRGPKARPLSETEALVVRRMADGEFGDVQALTVKDLVAQGVKEGTAISLLKPTKTAMKGLLSRGQALPGATDLDLAAHGAAISPLNDKTPPTKEQLIAGNAELGHRRVAGMQLSFENPAGSVRSDLKNTPPAWTIEMKDHYGYVTGTVGFDKDHLDTFVKPGTPEDFAGTVYVVNQNKGNGQFDEHKSILGADSPEDARAMYLRNYQPGFEKNIRSIVALPMEEFKAWAYDKTDKGPRGGPLEAREPFGDVKESGHARAVEDSLGSGGGVAAAAAAPAHGAGVAQPQQGKEALPPGEPQPAPAGVHPPGQAGAPQGKPVGKDAIAQARRAEQAWQKAPADIREFVKSVGKSMGYALRHGTNWEGAEAAERAARRQHEVQAALPYLREQLGIAKPAAEVKPTEERRHDRARRLRVEHMTPEEKNRALLMSEKAGIGNQRAYDESEKRAVQASLDIDGMKKVNDTMGHAAGDMLLAKVGEALRDAKIEGYHLSGDEFAAQFGDEDSAKKALEGVRKRLARATITVETPDGRTLTHEGIGFGYGLGKDLNTADFALQADKADRKARGLRAEREPAGVVPREAAAREQDQGRAPAAQEEEVGQAEEKPATAVVPKQQLFVEAGGKRFAVDSLEDASRKWDEFRTELIKAGGGSRDVEGAMPRIVDQDGKEVARISWNGKVWPPGPWTRDMQPLVESAKPPPRGAAFQAAQTKPARAPTKAEKKQGITDSGEELTYNARNRLRGISWDDVKDLNATLRVKEVTKEKVWPRPDYEKLVEEGMDAGAAHLVKQVYDKIATAPATRGTPTDEDLERYIRVVKRIEGAVLEWARANKMSAAPREGATLLDAAFPSASTSRYRFQTDDALTAEARVAGGNGLIGALQPGYTERRRALAAIATGWPAKGEAWQKQFQVRTAQAGETVHFTAEDGSTGATKAKGGEIYLTKVGSYRARTNLANGTAFFADEAAAQEYARSLVKRGREDDEPDAKPLDQLERQGPDRRAGKDVTADQLREAFGFRGVNFGNWMNQAERQAHLNHAFEAMHDLADLISVPPKAMSLNGLLGIAFGAQGRGGRAAAHFVPGVNEINITKTSGAGALAHEWGHALDHYFAVQNSDVYARDRAPFLTHHVNRPALGVRPEVVEAFRAVVRAMNKRPETEAEMKARMERAGVKVQPHTPQLVTSDYARAASGREKQSGKPYWSQPTEMWARAFESYVISALSKRGQRSDYLSGMVPMWEAQEKLGLLRKPFPYPKGVEKETIDKAIDTLLGALQTKPTDRGIALLSRPFRSKAHASGLSSFINEDVGLVRPRLAATQPLEAGVTRVGYDIIDTPAFKRWRAELGVERALARAKVGETLVDLKDGEFVGLWNIEIHPSRRGQGHGREAVASMLLSQDTPILIRDIQENAVDFWVKMGASFPRSSDYMEASLDRFQFATYNRQRGRVDEAETVRRDDAAGKAGVRGEAAGGAQGGLDFTHDESGKAGAPRTRRGFARLEAPPPAGLSISGVRNAVNPILKAWRNAPQVTVLANAAQMPTPISPDASGAFYKGRVYLIAANITSPPEALRTILHETAGHYGLAGILGHRLDATMLSIYNTNPTVRTLADQWMANNPRQSDQNPEAYTALAAEEALADLAGTGLVRDQGFWRWLMTAIRRALREAGFNIDFSDAEVTALLGHARKFVEGGSSEFVGGRLQVAQRREAKASRTGKEDMTRLAFAQKRMDEMVSMFESGSLKPETTTHLGETPPALQLVGIPADKLYITGAVIKKVLEKKHGWQIDADLVRQIPAQLFEPVLIFAPREQPGFMVVTELIDRTGNPVIVPIHVGVDDGRLVANRIASIYGLEAGIAKMEALARDGHLLYYDESKTANPPTTSRLSPEFLGRVPSVVQLGVAANPKVLSDADLVKRVGAKFSRGGFDIASLAPELQGKLNDILKTQKKFNFWHRTVGTQYHKAQVNREFKPVFEAAQRFVQDVSLIATEAADMAPALLPKLESLVQTAKDFLDVKGTRSHQADVKAIADAVYRGTLEDDRVYTDDELRNDFKLNPRQVQLYRQFRAGVDRSLDLLAVSEMGQLAQGYGKVDPGLPAVVAQAKDIGNPKEALALFRRHLQDLARSQPIAYQQEIAKTLNTLEEVVTRVEKLKIEGYAPLMRFGQHFVYFYSQDRAGNRKTEYFALHQNERDANSEYRRMVEVFKKDPKVRHEQGILSEESYKLFKGVSPESLELFAGALGVDEDVAKQAFLRLAISQRSALKRLIHRKEIAGYSEDVARTLASFITSNARLASRNYHMGELKDKAERIRAGDVKDDAVALVKYLEDPKEEAAKFRGFLFAQYLGGSAASAIINATQPITMTYPYLTQWAGPKDTGAHLLRGAQVALGKGDPDEELQGAMKRAADEGITEPAEIHQLYAESIRGLGSNIYLRRFFRLWGSAFQLAEQFNRKTTFAAAYEIARGLDADGLARAGAKTAYDFATTAVHETQGIYNKANRPNWGRGPIGATLMTFKQFSVSYLEFLSRLPRKQQALALAILLLSAGLHGLPFGEDLEDIIDTIAESLGYNWNTEKEVHEFIAESLGLGKAVADWVTYGASTLPGMPLDVQSRMGLGNLIPGTSLLRKSQPDKSRDALEVFGPAGGLIKSGIESFQAVQGGRFGGAAAGAAPVALQNIAKAADMAAQGYYRDTKGRRVLETDAVDVAVKAVGFQPADVASEQRRIGRGQQSISLVRAVEAEIANEWAQGVFERDTDKVRHAREKLAEWNQKNPESPIRIDASQIFRRVREMASLKAQRVVKAAPKEARGELVKDLHR